ncbi:MAG: hypothetical protein ACRETF_11580 [Nevskiaceae bacterium]
MHYVRAFVAGFLSTMFFHQGMIGLFYLAGVFQRAPWSLAATEPLGVPYVLSLAFWGGVWGIPIWYLMRHATGTAYWIRALVFGAIGPTVVAILVVARIKTGTFDAVTDAKFWIGGLIVNGVWGLGLALLMRGLKRVGV